jgi:hypothetical protein
VLGGRGHFGTLVVDLNLGHAVVIQRMDNQETWIGAWKDGIQSWNDVNVFGQPNRPNPSPYRRWSNWEHEPDTPTNQLGDCKIKWQYNKPELLQRLNQYRHLLEVFSHPLEESFQIKRVPNYRWEYPHCEPLWTPRLDQKAKWAPFQAYPAKMQK